MLKQDLGQGYEQTQSRTDCDLLILVVLRDPFLELHNEVKGEDDHSIEQENEEARNHEPLDEGCLLIVLYQDPCC